MGMKLKSGADLCGFQLTNFCVQGEASAPSDAALGRKYFHTNATDDVATGISLLHRERIYLGEGAWRATAYLDDIAAIQTKLDMILGDVDLDGVIENMNEVIKFLEDNKDTENLMTLLNDKLSKSNGGEINGALTISSPSWGEQLIINRTTGNAAPTIKFQNNGTTLCYLGARMDEKLYYVPSSGENGYALIHSGNIGSYALKRVDQVGDLNSVSAGEFFFSKYQAANRPSTNFSGGLTLQVLKSSTEDQRIQLAFGTDYVGYVRGYANGTYTAWKTIAFTDSIVDKARTLVDKNEVDLFKTYDTPNNHWSLGLVSHDAYIDAKNIYFRYSGAHTTAMSINSSGNVLIGTTTDNGAKLQVDGSSHFLSYIGASTEIQLGSRIPKSTMIGADKFGLQIWGQGDGITRMQVGRIDGQATAYDLYLQPLGGNVRIFGNLIVDGEVSAGGAGAEEGTSGGGGSVDFHSEKFMPSTSTLKEVNHNLGKDVIVQVYEEGATSDTWNLVMVDVEIVSATKLYLRFGKLENTYHKVVVMGAGV